MQKLRAGVIIARSLSGGFFLAWTLPVLLALFFFLNGCAANKPSGKVTIIVGSKNFPEQILLGEIVARLLERNSDRLHATVERRLNLGNTLVAHHALLAGRIDIYPEYTGTAFTAVLKHAWNRMDGDQTILKRVQEEYREAMQLEWMEPLGFSNPWAMVVSKTDGEPWTSGEAKKLSEAVLRRDMSYRLVVGEEFLERPDGYASLMSAYPIRWKDYPKLVDSLVAIYAKWEPGTMAAGSRTDAQVREPLVALNDDRNAFPPYKACLVVRRSKLDEVPGLREVLKTLEPKACPDNIRAMNKRVFECWKATKPADKTDPADLSEINSTFQTAMARCAGKEAEEFVQSLHNLQACPPEKPQRDESNGR